MFLQTKYEFTLPRGYVDEDGNVHRRGVMRMVTALDEIEAAKTPRAKENTGYMSVVLLSRVVTELEGLERITLEVIERLFPTDFKFLQNMYETINNVEEPVIQVRCPHCNQSFTDTLDFALGE